MLAPNDARLTALRCVEPETGSVAGVVAAGRSLDVVMSVEAGAAIFGTGARFAAGVQVEGVEHGVLAPVQGWLGGPDWPVPVCELRFRIPGAATAALTDRLLAVAGFMRANAAPPFIVSTGRAPDLFVTPGAPLP